MNDVEMRAEVLLAVLQHGACPVCGSEPECNIDCLLCMAMADLRSALAQATPAEVRHD